MSFLPNEIAFNFCCREYHPSKLSWRLCFCFSCSNCCFLLVKENLLFPEQKAFVEDYILWYQDNFWPNIHKNRPTIPQQVPCLPEFGQHSGFSLVLSTKKVTSADIAIFLPIAKIFHLEHLWSTCYKGFNSKLTLCFLCFGLTSKYRFYRININVCQSMSMTWIWENLELWRCLY